MCDEKGCKKNDFRSSKWAKGRVLGGHGGRLSSRSQTLHLCTLTERHVNTMLQPSVCPFNRTLVHVGCATRGYSVKVRSQ